MHITENSPYAPVLFLRTALAKEGLCLSEILSEAGCRHEMLDDPMAIIPSDELNEIWKIAGERINEPAIGFWASKHCDVPVDYGIVYNFFINQGSLRIVFENYFEGHRRLNPNQSCGLQPLEDGRYAFYISSEAQENWFEQQYMEASLAGVIHLFREISGYALQPDEVTFQFHPTGPVEAYEDFFGCPVRFAQKSLTMVFPEAWLQVPTIGSQQATVRHLQKVMDLLLPTHAHRNISWEQIVSRRIAQSFGGAKITLSSVSSQIGVKEEQLKYSLQKEGAVFRNILNRVRRQEAINKLCSESWNISEISNYLGYSESSTFTRNFQKWFGVSPNEYRKVSARRLAGLFKDA